MTLGYGKFIQTVLDFTIVAFAVFLLVKGINRLERKKDEAPPPPPSAEQQLLSEIRDLLRQQRG